MEMEWSKVYESPEEELSGYIDPYESVRCTECHQGGDDALMLLCDLCDSPAHTYCVGFGHEVPEGNWYCDVCRPTALASINAAELLNPTPGYGAKAPTLEALDLNKMCISETPLTTSTRANGCNSRSNTGPDASIWPYQSTKVYQPSEEDLRDYIDPEKFYCTECHDGGVLLLCDLCDSAAHTYCVGLGDEIPQGSWYCHRCKTMALASTNAAQSLNPIPDDGASNSLSSRL